MLEKKLCYFVLFGRVHSRAQGGGEARLRRDDKVVDSIAECWYVCL